MSRFKSVNPVRDESKAALILVEAAIEWRVVKTGNGNVRNGWNKRVRNRLMSEAGYEYNDAYYVVRDLEKSA